MKYGKAIAALALFCVAGFPVAASASAADYPSRPIRLVVPFSPGGGADKTARIVGQHLGDALGQSIIIENRPSAGGVVAEIQVARSDPDGYTILYDSLTMAVNASMRKMPIDIRTDLIPVSSTATAEMILVVNPSSGINSFQDFLARARAKPGDLTYASFGTGSPAHLAGELLVKEAGVDLLHVPYKGGALAVNDLLGGLVTSYFANPGSVLGFISSGKLRPLAVTSEARNTDLPDVPTMIELGYPTFDMGTWHGLFVPAGTPDAIIRKIDEATRKVLGRPEVQQQMKANGITPKISTHEEFSKFIRSEISRWSSFLADKNIVLD